MAMINSRKSSRGRSLLDARSWSVGSDCVYRTEGIIKRWTFFLLFHPTNHHQPSIHPDWCHLETMAGSLSPFPSLLLPLVWILGHLFFPFYDSWLDNYCWMNFTAPFANQPSWWHPCPIPPPFVYVKASVLNRSAIKNVNFFCKQYYNGKLLKFTTTNHKKSFMC